MLNLLARRQAIKDLITKDEWIKKSPGLIWVSVIQKTEFEHIHNILGSQLFSFISVREQSNQERSYLIWNRNRPALDQALIEINHSLRYLHIFYPLVLLLFLIAGIFIGKGIITLFAFIITLVTLLSTGFMIKNRLIIKKFIYNSFNRLINLSLTINRQKVGRDYIENQVVNHPKEPDNFLSKH